MSSADSGTALEKVKPFRFSLGDFAAALEVLHETGIWTYLPVNVRLLGRFWRVTGKDERGHEIVLLEAERLSAGLLALAERVTGPVTVIGSGDCAGLLEGAPGPVSVTCWAVPAVSVSVTVTSAGAEAGARLWP